MKKVYISIFVLLVAIFAFGQEPVIAEEPAEVEDPVAVEETEEIEVLDTPEKTRVTIGENEVIVIEENGDTIIVGLGSKGISIVEEDDGVKIDVLDMEKSKPCTKRKPRFKPHWAGFEIGLNNYVDANFEPASDYMDLNTGKSWNWNVNFAQYGIGLGTSYVGIASGLGFEFMNYHFDGQNSIQKDPGNGDIIEYVPSYAGTITKSKLNVAYITAPLILEFQIPTGRKRLHLSGGVVGGLKMWSNSKIKYNENGDKAKEKNKSDFNMSALRWGFTARAGYAGVGLYATYYMTPLFENNRGPEYFPFNVGIAFSMH